MDTHLFQRLFQFMQKNEAGFFTLPSNFKDSLSTADLEELTEANLLSITEVVPVFSLDGDIQAFWQKDGKVYGTGGIWNHQILQKGGKLQEVATPAYALKHGLTKSAYCRVGELNPEEEHYLQYGSSEKVQVTQIGPDSLEISIGKKRTYRIEGLEKKPRTLRITLRFLFGRNRAIPNSLNLYSSQARDRCIREFCRRSLCNAETILKDMERITEVCENYKFSGKASTANAMTDERRKRAIEFGKNLDLENGLVQDAEECGLVGETINFQLLYLCSVSRLLPKPLASCILSSSGSGKSHLVASVLKFFPEEDMHWLSALSAKSLFYMDATDMSLKNKILFIEEDQGAEKADYSIRQLISSDKMTIQTSCRDMLDGKIKASLNTVDCQTAVFWTSTSDKIDPETKSRCLILQTDETHTQTQKILELQRQSRLLSSLSKSKNREDILQVHRDLQRILQSYYIVNPYVESLDIHASGDLSSRRNFPKFLTLIDSICLIRQFQKEIKEVNGLEYLEVEEEDIELATKLISHVINNSISELHTHSRELLSYLQKKKQDETFTRSQLQKELKWSLSKTHRAIDELKKHEFLVLRTGGRGKLHTYALVKAIQTYSKDSEQVPAIDGKELTTEISEKEETL